MQTFQFFITDLKHLSVAHVKKIAKRWRDDGTTLEPRGDSKGKSNLKKGEMKRTTFTWGLLAILQKTTPE